MSRLIIFPVLSLFMTLGQPCRSLPQGSFDQTKVPAIPDYGKMENWAALPDRVDEADRLPKSTLTDRQKEAKVDVFFLHPTSCRSMEGLSHQDC